MQLPDHLFRTYRTYKIEEQNFLRWIYETAFLYGHKFELRRPVEQVPKTDKVVCHDQAYSKLKGRARALARRTAQAPPKPNLSTTNDGEEVNIAIFDILPAISCIVEHSQTQIPDLVLNQVQKILDLRRSCVDWFRNNTPQNDHKTRCHNENHEYPVRILEQAFTVLSAANRTSKTAPDSMKQLSIDSNTTKVNLMFNGSRYAALQQMGDSSDATEYLKDNRKNIDLDGDDEPLASKKTDPRIQQSSTPRLDEDLKLQEEYNFARFCFYKDVQQIEDFLFLEIVRYALDAANSDVLPFLTDVAIDVIGCMEESLDASFDNDHTYHLKFWTSSQDHSILYETPLLRMQWVIIHARRELAGKHAPDECYETSFDPDVDYFNLHPMEQGAVEQHCLASILHEASQVAGPSFGVLSRDSSTKMFNAIFDNPQVQTLDSVMPAAIVFAVRLRILTIIVAKDMVSTGLRSLKQSVEGISELQAKRAAFFNSQDYKSSRMSQLWQSRIKWSLSDWAHTELSYKDKPQDPFSKLLRSNLLTCCLSRSRLRGDYAAGFVCSIDASGIFRILAHLFNLLSECNILDVDWPDLSFLLSLFGEAYVYHNRRPTLKITSSFTSQIFHSLGLTEKQIAQFFLEPHETQIQKLLMRFKPQFSRHLFPLSMIHCLKQAYLPYQHEIGAIDVKLVAAASVLPKLLGKQSMKARFTEKCALENKAELGNFVTNG